MDDLRLYQSLPPSLATRLCVFMHHEIITRSAFLRHLPDDQLVRVLSRARSCIFVPMQVVYAEGVLLSTLFFLKNGKVDLLRRMGDEASEQLVGTVGQHESFGIDLTEGGKHSDTAVENGWESTYFMQAAKQQISLEGARARTYCDVTTLALSDLHAIFSRDQGWTRLQQNAGGSVHGSFRMGRKRRSSGSFRRRARGTRLHR